MARQTIILDADTSPAQAEFRDLAREASAMDGKAKRGVDSLDRSVEALDSSSKDAARSLDRLGKESKSMGASMARMGSITTGVNSAFALAGRATSAFTGSMEQFLRQTKDGDKLWEQLERRLRGVRGGLASMLLGTNDATEGYEDLDQMAWMVQSTMQALTDEIGLQEGRLVELVRGGLTYAIRAFSALRTGQHNLQQTMGLVAIAVNTAALGWELFGGVIINLRAVVAEFTTGVLGSLIDGLGSVVGAAASLAEHLGRRRLGASLSSMSEGMGEAADSVRGLDSDLETLNEERMAQSQRSIAAWGRGVEEITDGMIEAGAAADEERRSLDELIASLDGVPPAQDEAARSSRSHTEAMEAEAGAAMALASTIRERIMLQQELNKAKGDEGARLASEAMEAERATAAAALADEKTKAATAVAADQLAEQERVEGIIGTYEGYGRALVGVFEDVAAGQEGAVASAVKAIGSELIAVGEAGLMEAAILAFSPGMQIAAAGKAAAAAAAIAAGSLMQRTGRSGGQSAGSAVGAGLAPPAQAQSTTTVTNTTTQVNNFRSVIGTPSLEDQRQAVHTMRLGMANGY